MQPYLPRLGAYQPIFNTRFKRKSDSRFVMAQMLSPKTGTAGGLELQYRLVRVSPKSPLIAGDVILSVRKYLLLDSGREERQGPDYAVFKAVELDRSTTVMRGTKTTDTITKRVNETLASVGTMDYAEVPLRQEEDTLRIQSDHYEILTDFPLQVGDKLVNSSRVVHQVEKRYGAYWAKVRDA